MKKVDGLCSAGGEDVTQEVTVAARSAASVYFTAVPLIIGRIPIDVLAYASEDVADRMKKDLLVVVPCNSFALTPHFTYTDVHTVESTDVIQMCYRCCFCIYSLTGRRRNRLHLYRTQHPRAGSE